MSNPYNGDTNDKDLQKYPYGLKKKIVTILQTDDIDDSTIVGVRTLNT